MTSGGVAFSARVERKGDTLPCYLVVPAGVVAELGVRETTVVEVALAGAPVGRRTLERWDDDDPLRGSRTRRTHRFAFSPGM